mgnify:CR=1 FL=1
MGYARSPYGHNGWMLTTWVTYGITIWFTYGENVSIPYLYTIWHTYGTHMGTMAGRLPYGPHMTLLLGKFKFAFQKSKHTFYIISTVLSSSSVKYWTEFREGPYTLPRLPLYVYSFQ